MKKEKVRLIEVNKKGKGEKNKRAHIYKRKVNKKLKKAKMWKMNECLDSDKGSYY